MNANPTWSETEPTRHLLDKLLGGAGGGRIGFRLWDGTRWPDAEPRAATVVLAHPGALAELCAHRTEKALAEAFIAGHIDVEGDLESACELADRLTEAGDDGWLAGARRLQHLRQAAAALRPGGAWNGETLFGAWRHTRARDRQAVRFHYDISNDFYRLWLDRRMLYSCAYFEHEHDPLEVAQEAKLRHLGRKLRLRRRQRLLDIGCGWGGLAVDAAQKWGVRVLGVTLSEQQGQQAARWVRDAGLEAAVRIEVKDYRDIDEPEGFDAAVSVGMAEHVGTSQLKAYFGKVFDLLKPGGVFLNHAIGDGVRARANRGGSFIQEYVFPNSDLQHLPVVLAAAEAAGFEVRDVENLREHYALTLRHWVRRLEAAHAAAIKLVDERTYRIWRLYLAGSARGFARGRLAVYQTLLVKPDRQGAAHLPLTRRDWYPVP